MTAKNATLRHVTAEPSHANLEHAAASAQAIMIWQSSPGDWSWHCSWCETGEHGTGKLITRGAAERAAADHETAEHWR